MVPPPPITSTYAALAHTADGVEMDFGTSLGRQSGGRWHGAADVLDDAPAFDALVERFGRVSGTARRDIAGAFVLSDWSFAVLARAAACFLVDRRVPALRHEGIWLHRHPEEWVDRVALGAEFACLPGDPAAAHPTATVVADEAALLEVLVERYAAHQAPLVQLVHARCRRPQRALWRHSSDTLAEAFMWAGEAMGRRLEGWSFGERAVAGAAAPLAGPAGFRVWQVGPREHIGRVRAQCCLNYRCDTPSYCFSCPLKDERHRCERLREEYGVDAVPVPAG